MKDKHVSKFVFGATVVGAAAAGILAFFTQSPKGKKVLKDGIEHGVALLTLIAKKTEKMKSLTAASYARLVDEVMAEYAEHKTLTEETAKVMNAALKKEWKTIQRGLKTSSIQKSKTKK